MQSDLFQQLIDAIDSLTPSQRQLFEITLAKAKLSWQTEENESSREDDDSDVVDNKKNLPTSPEVMPDLETTIEQSFSRHPHCPECHNDAIVRWGKRQGRQRYRCKTCQHTFNAFSQTPLARLRHAEKWPKYLSGMTHSLTLRPAARECAINLKTAFCWRHRFLACIEGDQAHELTGIIELDETFFRESFKGQRSDLPRPSRKRGNDPNKACQIGVMVARDHQNHTVDGVLENESAKELCRHLNGRISMEAVVCADAHLAHEKLAEILGYEFKELVTSMGQHVIEGIYHIQHVNSYHSHLKRWIGGIFHGVATKFLSHYLGWRRELTEKIPLTTETVINKIAAHWCGQPFKTT